MELPQEIELWYVIPVIRRELAKKLKEKDLKQKQIAVLLEITEPAVSQYLKNKRAKEIDFNEKVNKAITKAADLIVKKFEKDNKIAFKQIYKICKMVRDTRLICKIHKHKNANIDKCDICYK